MTTQQTEERKEARREKARDYYQEHRAQLLEYAAEYRKKHARKLNEYRKAWAYRQYHTDPEYRAKMIERSKAYYHRKKEREARCEKADSSPN